MRPFSLAKCVHIQFQFTCNQLNVRFKGVTVIFKSHLAINKWAQSFSCTQQIYESRAPNKSTSHEKWNNKKDVTNQNRENKIKYNNKKCQVTTQNECSRTCVSAWVTLNIRKLCCRNTNITLSLFMYAKTVSKLNICYALKFSPISAFVSISVGLFFSAEFAWEVIE